MKISNLALALLFAVLVVFAVGGRVSVGVTDPSSTDAQCGKCGDNYCNPRCGETATTCPRDCGATF